MASYGVDQAGSPTPESAIPGLLPESPPVCRAFDPAKWAFDIGVTLLAAYGHDSRAGRAIVARWAKRWEPYKLVEILMRAAERERGDVVLYIEAAWQGELAEATALSDRAEVDTRRKEEERFRRRVEGFKKTRMLHLLDAQEMARAVHLGLVDPKSL